MTRADLDAFFAKADDVLTDWHGSVDSMSTAATEPPPYEWRTAAWSRGAPMGSVGLFQMSPPGSFTRALARWRADAENAMRSYSAALEELSRQCGLGSSALADFAAAFRAESGLAKPTAVDGETPRDRALRLRRERNTGPVVRHGLDGRTRRP